MSKKQVLKFINLKINLFLLLLIILIIIRETIESPISSTLYSNNNNNNNRSDERKQTAIRASTEWPDIIGIRAEGDEKVVSIGPNLESVVKADKQLVLRLFGPNLNRSDIEIGFTIKRPDPTTGPTTGSRRVSCQPNVFDFKTHYVDDFTLTATISILNEGKYYLCITYAKEKLSTAGSHGKQQLDNNLVKREAQKHYYYVSCSANDWTTIIVEQSFLPFWAQILLIAILLVMSGLFSGLNLGLMALDKNELQVIERCGTEQEKRYARAITPVRKRGNYLLCTLLLGNVLVNSTLTIFLDALTSGFVAVIGSTLSIVIFGEIIPQALCSRHGLAVGARTVWLTYIFMVATFPLSFPISKILDKVLGEEIGNVYDRERLMEYIRVTKDYNRLEADEVNIISGALKLKKIKVTEIMTPISDVVMLPYNAILNFETLNMINSSGYSRIPIYENEKNNVVAILHAKDLAFIDPDNNMPLKVLIEFTKHPLYFVYEDVTLDVMLNEFKQGKSHMAFVRRINDDGINDPVYELAGVVTLEDVIEELIQAEINDETDVISDNRRKQKRKEVTTRPNYSDFVRLGGSQDSDKLISSQLALAAFRYLSTFVEPFTPQFLSENVLKRLMSKRIYFEMKVELNAFASDIPNENKLYSYGKPADYFILILDGRVKVIIGKENQQYESGPFTYFGVSSLKLSASDNERVSKSTSLGRLSITETVSQQQSTQDTGIKSSPSTTSTINYRPSLTDGSIGIRDTPFIPDFTAFCVENTTYMKVTRNLYMAAIRTTIMEKQRDSQSVDPEDDGIIHFELDANTDNQTLVSNSSSANLLPQIGRLQSTSSTSKLQPSGGGSNKHSPGGSSRASASTPDPLPKYEELSNCIIDKNSDKDINDSEKRNSSPADEKSHLI